MIWVLIKAVPHKILFFPSLLQWFMLSMCKYKSCRSFQFKGSSLINRNLRLPKIESSSAVGGRIPHSLSLWLNLEADTRVCDFDGTINQLFTLCQVLFLFTPFYTLSPLSSNPSSILFSHKHWQKWYWSFHWSVFLYMYARVLLPNAITIGMSTFATGSSWNRRGRCATLFKRSSFAEVSSMSLRWLIVLPN